jgi:hypothetical protein
MQFLLSPMASGDDVVDDVLGVPADTTHQRRTQRVKKKKSDEVEAGTGLDDAAIVNRDAVVGGKGEIDPLKTGCEPGAPNYIRYLEDSSILE